MISWWVALKLYVSQTALEGTHKSSHPESRSLNPYFSHRLNYVPARFCWFGGSPIGLIGGLWATAWVKAQNDGAHLTFPRGSDWRPCSRISMESPITLENTPHLSFSIGSKVCQKASTNTWLTMPWNSKGSPHIKHTLHCFLAPTWTVRCVRTVLRPPACCSWEGRRRAPIWQAGNRPRF